MCAALEMGCDRVPARQSWGDMWSEDVPLGCDQPTELRIYSVTSGTAGSLPVARLGHSLPSYICETATVLGLHGSVYVKDNFFGTALEFIFRSEFARAKDLRVRVYECAPPSPTDSERLLRVIRNGPDYWLAPAVKLHWIMERPDGSIMDPAGAQYGFGPGEILNAPDFGTLVNLRASQGVEYIDSGIGILLRPATPIES